MQSKKMKGIKQALKSSWIALLHEAVACGMASSLNVDWLQQMLIFQGYKNQSSVASLAALCSNIENL
jgi:hypothetical protein